MSRLRLIFAFIGLVLWHAPVVAQVKPPPSECLAIAQSIPRVMFASFSRAAAEKGEVTIT
jgi:hypothetical protein